MSDKRKRYRRLKKAGIYLLGFLTLVWTLVFTSVDYTHYHNTDYFKRTIARLDSLPSFKKNHEAGELKAGWGRANITPSKKLRLASYGNRGDFQGIGDSLYVRVIALKEAETTVFMITYDLLLLDEKVARSVEDTLKTLYPSLNGIYFSATHTHSSYGQWAEGSGLEAVLGEFDPAVKQMLVDRTVGAVALAYASMESVETTYFTKKAETLVHNRIVDRASTDDYVRVLGLRKKNGSTALYTSFSAHPTNLPFEYVDLSNDYPGEICSQLVKDKRVDFAMFSAGAVGSSAGNIYGVRIHDYKDYGKKISDPILDTLSRCRWEATSSIDFQEFNFEVGDSQFRPLGHWRIRPWLFEKMYKKPRLSLKFLKINEFFFVGTPCDFSGVFVDEIAKKSRISADNLFVTSFNGAYAGYAVPLEYYELNHTETRFMNFYGPYLGEYLAEVISKGLGKFN